MLALRTCRQLLANSVLDVYIKGLLKDWTHF